MSIAEVPLLTVSPKHWQNSAIVKTHSFALPILPVLIRSPEKGPQRWIYFGRYTRLYRWEDRLNRYKTIDTFEGWQ